MTSAEAETEAAPRSPIAKNAAETEAETEAGRRSPIAKSAAGTEAEEAFLKACYRDSVSESGELDWEAFEQKLRQHASKSKGHDKKTCAKAQTTGIKIHDVD